MKSNCVGLMLILCLATIAGAQSVDSSSPKAAAKSFTAAVARADGDAVRNLILVENDPGQELVNAYANLLLAGRRLSEAAKKRYPGVNDPFAAGGIAPEDAAQIDAGELQVEGEIANLRTKGRERPLKLRKVGDAWKVIISEEPADQTPQHRADQIELLQGLAGAMNSCADDIAAGRFRDAADARSAVKQRLGAVAARARQPQKPTTSKIAT